MNVLLAMPLVPVQIVLCLNRAIQRTGFPGTITFKNLYDVFNQEISDSFQFDNTLEIEWRNGAHKKISECDYVQSDIHKVIENEDGVEGFVSAVEKTIKQFKTNKDQPFVVVPYGTKDTEVFDLSIPTIRGTVDYILEKVNTNIRDEGARTQQIVKAGNAYNGQKHPRLIM